MNPKKFEISSNCWFELWKWDESEDVHMHYIEHSPDPWYSDNETDVDIDRTQAIGIIKFLCDAFDIKEEEIS